MKFRSTLILLVVFALLGGYVYWTWEKEPPKTTSTEAITILECDPQTIYAIEVQDDGDELVRLEKDPDRRIWHLSIPVTDTADLLQVTRVVTDLSKLQATRAIPMAEAQTLDTYGLKPPRYEVHLFDADGGIIASFRLGEQNPARTARYVQYGEEPYLYLVSSYLFEPVIRWVTMPPIQPTPTPTIAVIPTVQATNTPTATLTPTVMRTITATGTPTGTATPVITRTRTVTGTATPVITRTATVTATATPVITRTATVTATPVITRTATGTATPVITRTATGTATPVITRTATGTATSTETQAATPTITRTATMTVAGTPVIPGTATSLNPSRTPTVTIPQPTRTHIPHTEEEHENEHHRPNR